MHRLVFILALFCPSRLWGLTPSLTTPTLLNELEVLPSPLGVIQPDELVYSDSSNWVTVPGGKTYNLKPKTDHFLRFRLPELGPGPLTIQYYFTNTNSADGLYADAYAIGSGQLQKLTKVDSQFAAWLVPEPSRVSAIIIRSRNQTPWYIGSNLIIKAATVQDHAAVMRSSDLMFGLIAGIVGIMIVYNFGMQVVFRRSFYFSYVLYTAAALYWHIFFYGYIGYSPIFIGLFFACMGLVLLAMLHFIANILNAETEFPRLYRLMRLQMAFFALLTLGLFSGVELFTHLFIVLYALPMLTCLTVAVLSAKRRYKPAYPILLGWIIMCFAALLSILDAMLVHIVDTTWALAIAGAFEIATFSFAVGQRFRLTELEFIKQNKHAFNQMKKIIYPHQLQQIRDGQEIEQTMPTHEGPSCVICFDIVGSTRIKNVRANQFFRNVFRKCYALMMEGYNGDQDLRAKAYRIKELGDGFLCSVGHPFQSLSSNPALEAVELAQQFVEILQKEAFILGADTAIHGSIGIASGPIRGYYPETGVKEYELTGSAIVLATRYEAMRRVLAIDPNQSVVIIQEAIYARLPARLRQKFARIELSPGAISVRDDPDATALYIQYLPAALSKAG